jgi:hypothetical protein
VFFRTRLCRHFFIRENPCDPWLQNDPGVNGLRCDKSQISRPRITRNFTDETAPHIVSFLTRKPHRPLPLYACCDFAFSLFCDLFFFVFSCLRVRYVPSAGIWTHPENWVAGEVCSKCSVVTNAVSMPPFPNHGTHGTSRITPHRLQVNRVADETCSKPPREVINTCSELGNSASSSHDCSSHFDSLREKKLGKALVGDVPFVGHDFQLVKHVSRKADGNGF